MVREAHQPIDEHGFGKARLIVERRTDVIAGFIHLAAGFGVTPLVSISETGGAESDKKQDGGHRQHKDQSQRLNRAVGLRRRLGGRGLSVQVRLHLGFGGRGGRVGVGWVRTVNQHEVAKVDDASDTLSGNEDGIQPIDRIGQRNEPPDQTHIPEGRGDPTFCVFLRGNPLDDPTHEKYALPNESDDQPELSSVMGEWRPMVMEVKSMERGDIDSAGNGAASIARPPSRTGL